ncbi:MerR family transcriptional regulator [Rhodococcus sp. MSC1_016]|jgi:DNA-binding transcriptional MerR regulator|uniref:MerR family transcriptional regulator n=1 Tax=Rhodococcus sp. MSC1_016 TaxID=2909266 RepID=UPI00202F71ED|nr:MerR family transcriptional regulator [Rhodococcus sp. MSC1_016]
MSTYRISQLAELSAVPATTLRFYETAGLLPAARTASGYRVYDDDAVDRLAFISSAKLLGLPLEEIRELLEVWEQGVCAHVRQRMLPMITERITDADGRIAELSAFSAHLARVRTDLSQPPPTGACGPECGCLTTAPTTPVAVSFTRTRPEPAPALDDRPATPVACTHGGDQKGERIQQWRQVLDSATGREDIDGGLRLRFPADPDLVADVARLATAEQGCCAFFDFTLQLTPGALVMSVRAPEAAEPLVTELFGVRA